MDRFPDLSVRVTTFDHRPLAGARVTARSAAGAVATATTDAKGRARLHRADAGEVLVRVEAPGLEPQERTVSGERPEGIEPFVLGRPGMPFYYRGTVRVPFQPIDDAVGVVLRDRGADASGQPHRVDPGEVTARARRLAEEPDVTLLRSEGNFARSGIAVIGMQEDRVRRDPDALLESLAASDEVEHAGALVQLSDKHASFLTETVVARFADGVDDAAVAQIAARHGLTPLGRFGDLGNVHRLRFGGPATYAVLDASNALAAEPLRSFSEPDLVHTEVGRGHPHGLSLPRAVGPSHHQHTRSGQVLHADPGRNFRGPDIIIAVVDVGVEVTHPEFSGPVLQRQAQGLQTVDFVTMQPNINNLPNLGRLTTVPVVPARLLPEPTTAQRSPASTGVAGVAGNCRLIAIRRGGPESRYAEMYLWVVGFDANSSTAGFPAGSPLEPTSSPTVSGSVLAARSAGSCACVRPPDRRRPRR